jgi:predicted dehydrogenase
MGQRDTDSVVKVGVIGVGHYGRNHARVYADLAETELAGVADIDEETARSVADQFGTQPYTDYREMLGEVSAVSVAVPTSMHHSVSADCLRAGVHVMVEKPIAARASEADDLVDLADGCGLVLQVGHVERFNGAIRKLHEVVDRPLFIEAHRLSTYPDRNVDVDVVLDLMIHEIDIVLSLVGSPVTSVDAVGVPVLSDSEDIANARVKFESGCVANLTASRVSVTKMRKIRVFSTDAYVSLNYDDQRLSVYRRKPGEPAPGESRMTLVNVQDVPVDRGEPLKLELESFLHCVRTGEQPVVSGRDGRAALALAQEIADSVREASVIQ